jgi:hypothetical protein
MSSQNKMASDYLWVRHAPIEEGLKVKNHGLNYLYNRAPNRIERLEMVYRSLGKTYDWELEKFRLAKKPVDKGNKKRLFRNIARFIKHPLGYVGWTIGKWQTASTPRIVMAFLVLTWVSIAYEWKRNTRIIQEHDDFLLASGKNIEGMSGRYTGYHDTKPLRGPSWFDLGLRVPLTPDQLIINQTWKQNIRKELQLTNANRVEFN